jgi:hypothetical protein
MTESALQHMCLLCLSQAVWGLKTVFLAYDTHFKLRQQYCSVQKHAQKLVKYILKQSDDGKT